MRYHQLGFGGGSSPPPPPAPAPIPIAPHDDSAHEAERQAVARREVVTSATGGRRSQRRAGTQIALDEQQERAGLLSQRRSASRTLIG